MDAHTLKFTKTSEVGILSEEGKFFVGFWLYDTGGYPIMLSARLIGQSSLASVQQVINFQCGDSGMHPVIPPKSNRKACYYAIPSPITKS
jgi:hypothetical protein